MKTDIDLEFNLTPDEFQEVRGRFLDDGVDVPDDRAGLISMSGVMADFVYNGSVLKIHISEKPFLAPDSMVINKLKDYIEEIK